jgi:hypothetical protein
MSKDDPCLGWRVHMAEDYDCMAFLNKINTAGFPPASYKIQCLFLGIIDLKTVHWLVEDTCIDTRPAEWYPNMD